MKKLLVVVILAMFVCTGLVYAADKGPVVKAVNTVSDTAKSAVTGTANVAETTVTDTGSTAQSAVDAVGDTANAAVSGTKSVVDTVTGSNK